MPRLRFWFQLYVGLSLLVLPALGVAAARDLKKEEALEAELQRHEPALVPVFRAARIAGDAEKLPEAIRGYEEVATKAPNFDPALRRLGTCLVRQGRYAEGLAWCERALALRRSADNLGALAWVLLQANGGKADDRALRRAETLFAEARQQPDGQDEYTLFYSAIVALRRNQTEDFRRLQEQMQAKFPEEMGTHYLTAVRAAMEEHWIAAERAIRRAEAKGLPAAAVREFLDSGIGARATAWRVIWALVTLVGGWALALVGLCALGAVLSRLTLREVQAANVSLRVNTGEHRLRRVYRLVVNVAGVYYYLSLPIIIVLVVGTCAGIIYGFLVIGQIPIKLTLVLVVGALVTVWAMIKSLFVKVKTEEPGRVLARSEAEGLWLMAEDVARQVGTRPIDEIRVTPGTELAVYERGSWRDKLHNRAQRILILGVGNLRGFKLDDFRCVLAHEYGHFSHRDTAGGEIALRVRQDMMKFYYAMAEAGQATVLNLAFHFLRAYNFMFRRITHGATRLQEVLADRVAVQAYGAAALEGGLRQVIRKSIEFDRWAEQEVKAAIETRRPLANFYAGAVPEGGQVEEALQKAFTRPTTKDDTHPSPCDRIRLVANVPPRTQAAQSGEVWQLLAQPEALEAEMLAELEKRVAPHRPS